MTPKRSLITGSPDRVEALGKAFETAGDAPVTLAEVGSDTAVVDRYVQLGVSVPARGDTIVRRVHSFLSDGLLERFVAAERVLPFLADDAIVLLVAGNTPAEAAAPDDHSARLSMLRVLAHAIRADLAPQRVRVRVVSGEHTDEEIVELALSGAKDPLTDPSLQRYDLDASGSYSDWRIQVLGLAQVEV